VSLPGATTSRPFVTQAAWRIPAKEVCSFQTAICCTRSSISSGEGLDESWQIAVNFCSITLCGYHKAAPHYSRTVAVAIIRGMLSSSGDFLKTFSAILSGEGLFDGKRRIAALPISFFRNNQ
jgi:hypothetical protein